MIPIARGEFAAKSLTDNRKKWRKKYKKYKKEASLKFDPLEGSPQGRALVLEKRGVPQKQPHSGLCKCVRVQLIKNGVEVTAFAPRDGAIKFIDEHDEVIIEGVGGGQGGPYGSQWGVKYRVTHVNGQALEMLRSGRKEKVKR